MAARREVIRPDFDPVIIRLDKDATVYTQREGQQGVDYQFIINADQGIMWLNKAGRDALVNTGAKAGDSVEICKARRGNATLFFAQRVNDTHESGMPTPQPARQLAGVAVAEAPKATYPPIPQAQPQQIRAVNVSAEQLSFCLRAAIDAMVAGRDYAASRALTLDGPSWEDVRCMALSIYIARTRDGGNR
jgi:hypothetical protein